MKKTALIYLSILINFSFKTITDFFENIPDSSILNLQRRSVKKSQNIQ